MLPNGRIRPLIALAIANSFVGNHLLQMRVFEDMNTGAANDIKIYPINIQKNCPVIVVT